jgi:hypothetical protein
MPGRFPGLDALDFAGVIDNPFPGHNVVLACIDEVSADAIRPELGHRLDQALHKELRADASPTGGVDLLQTAETGVNEAHAR